MTVQTARLDLRLDTRDKERIHRAAELRGQAVSAFIRDVVLREAEATLANPPRGGRSVSARLRGRATVRMGTDEIMKLTRGA